MKVNKINHYSMNNPCSVYDEEALTALELSARTAKKLNDVIDSQNELIDTTNETLTDHKDFIDNSVDEIKTVTVPEIVNTHIVNGSFDKQIGTHLDNLNERVDNVLGLPHGSTTGDAELADIRIGKGGVNFPNAGEAVRKQLEQLDTMHNNNSIYNMKEVSNHLGRPVFQKTISAMVSNDSPWQYVSVPVELETGNYIIVINGHNIPEGGYIAVKQTPESILYSPQINAELATSFNNVVQIHRDNTESINRVILFQLSQDAPAVPGYYYANVSIYKDNINTKQILPDEMLGLDNVIKKQIGINIVNPQKLHIGGYWTGAGNINYGDNQFYYSERIPVKSGGFYHILNQDIGGCCICVFNNLNTMIGCYNNADTTPTISQMNGILSIPEDGTTIAISGYTADIDRVMIHEVPSAEHGCNREYIPYTDYAPMDDLRTEVNELKEMLNNKVEIILNEAEYSARTPVLLANKNIVFENLPCAKNGLVFCVNFEFQSLSGPRLISVIHGENPYSKYQLDINATEVQYAMHTTEMVEIFKENHGLTFNKGDRIMLIGECEANKLKITLWCNDQVYKCIQKWNGSGTTLTLVNYPILRNVYMTTHYKTITNDVWLFGDSYLDYWTSYSDKVKNIYLDGYSGRNSQSTFEEMHNHIMTHRPKIIVWGLGVNDDFFSWYTGFDSIRSLCADLNIKLIPVTVPVLEGRSGAEQINEYIKTQSDRYIDLASLFTNHLGETVPGMLTGDGVHPSEKGSQMIANLFECELPEIFGGV